MPRRAVEVALMHVDARAREAPAHHHTTEKPERKSPPASVRPLLHRKSRVSDPAYHPLQCICETREGQDPIALVFDGERKGLVELPSEECLVAHPSTMPTDSVVR